MLHGLIRTSATPNTIFTVSIGYLIAIFLGAGVFSVESLISLAFVIIVLSVFWQGNYLFNDYFDLDHDKKNPKKKHRGLASGIISPKKGLAIALIIILSTLLILLMYDYLLFIFALSMFIIEILYCMKPIRLKERYPINIFIGGPINHFFRFLSGWIIIAPMSFDAFLIALLITSIAFIPYVFYRIQNGGEHYKKIGMKLMRRSFYFSLILILIYALFGILTYLVIIIPFAIFFYFKLEKMLTNDMSEKDIQNLSILYGSMLMVIVVVIVFIFSFI